MLWDVSSALACISQDWLAVRCPYLLPGSIIVRFARTPYSLLLFWHAPLGVRSITHRHQPPEDGSGPGRLLSSVWGCRLSDLARQCSAKWYEDALMVSTSYLVGEPLESSWQCTIHTLKCNKLQEAKPVGQWMDSFVVAFMNTSNFGSVYFLCCEIFHKMLIFRAVAIKQGWYYSATCEVTNCSF